MQPVDILVKLQRDYMNDYVLSDENKRIHESWFDESTTDFWRHKHMYETLRPFTDVNRDSSWLTVGDGRYALDAIRMKKLFQLSTIFPTDISENMLRISKERGLIENYGVENAEQLSFADNGYDIVFCKEAFHHFPRPYLALYEMIRVSKKAVVMIEPAEPLFVNRPKSNPYLVSALQLFVSKLLRINYYPFVPGINKLNHSYETSGNYLYAVSVRELEKLVHGMGLAGLAWKGFNDVYEKGCEFETAQKGNPLFDKISSAIADGDSLCRQYPGFHQPNMVTVILFKEKPDETLQQQLRNAGYIFPVIHSNPYL